MKIIVAVFQWIQVQQLNFFVFLLLSLEKIIKNSVYYPEKDLKASKKMFSVCLSFCNISLTSKNIYSKT